jgi:hypothetical protein
MNSNSHFAHILGDQSAVQADKNAKCPFTANSAFAFGKLFVDFTS